MGALTPLYAGVSPETDHANGKVCHREVEWLNQTSNDWIQYFIPWAREGKASAATNDKELGERLWKWLEVECKE